MEDENIVQQVDSYVRELLSVAERETRGINPESPTRGQRLRKAKCIVRVRYFTKSSYYSKQIKNSQKSQNQS